MAKKKAAKKKSAPARKSAKQALAEVDARIAKAREQEGVREAVKGIVREVLDDERKDLLNHAQERFHDLVRDAKAYAGAGGGAAERGPIAPPGFKPTLHAPYTSAVAGHLDELYSASMKLGETIAILEDRLEPVLQTGGEARTGTSDPTTTPRPPVSCMVASRVDDTREQIEVFRARVDDIMRRLQV